MKLGTNTHIKAGHGNSVGEKVSQAQLSSEGNHPAAKEPIQRLTAQNNCEFKKNTFVELELRHNNLNKYLKDFS